MAAERGRAALLDRRHHLKLTQAHMPGIGSPPGGSMAMKTSATSSLGRRTAAGYASGCGLPSIKGASRSSGLVTARIVVLATRV
jgi:hypothetical protein